MGWASRQLSSVSGFRQEVNESASVSWITEALNTADLKDAKALLDELSPSSRL
jgi:hypothetical protein